MASGKTCRRDGFRRPCRGEVSVVRLTGGPAIRGRLVDLGGGGARFHLDQRLAVGEAIRVIFPNRPGAENRPGRIIIGRVAHSSAGPSGCTIGVEFGWSAASCRGGATHRADPPNASRPGLLARWFSRKPSRGVQRV